jgi:hypothetical protein
MSGEVEQIVERLVAATSAGSAVDLEEVLRLSREAARAAKAAAARTRAKLLSEFEQQLGPATLKLLIEDRDAAARSLDDPDPRLRRCALYLLMSHWRSPEEFVGRCEELAVSDPDEGVRQTAIIKLARHYYGTSDRRVGALLARLVRSEREPPSVRLDAYRGLVVLRGADRNGAKNLLDLRFPEDVDWKSVDRFLG